MGHQYRRHGDHAGRRFGKGGCESHGPGGAAGPDRTAVDDRGGSEPETGRPPSLLRAAPRARRSRREIGRDAEAMKLSQHFSLEELTASETAARQGIDNTPDTQALTNLIRLAETLERVRRSLDGHAMTITSGYRSE